MDVLSDVLDHLRLRGTLYFSTEFTRPWGVLVPSLGHVARFHLVVRGSVWLRVGEAEAIHLEAGDLVLVPHGAAHVIADGPDSPAPRVDQVVEESGFDGSGALVYGGPDRGSPTRLVCGHFEFDERFGFPLLDRLPPAMIVRWDEAVGGSPLENAFSFVTREVLSGQPGHSAIVRRLSEVLFVAAVRVWAEHHPTELGLLRAIADPRIGPALQAIHTDPARGWTLETLARRAALGRATFSARFREVVGETPHGYLTRWRMQGARRLLAESHLPLAAIASEVGYDSAASFSRAFKKEVGTSPGAYRRGAQVGAA